MAESFEVGCSYPIPIPRSFSMHGKEEAPPTEMQVQLGNNDIRATPGSTPGRSIPRKIYNQIADPDVARMVNQVTNRILGLAEEVEPVPSRLRLGGEN
jgi:hypothetical protein